MSVIPCAEKFNGFCVLVFQIKKLEDLLIIIKLFFLSLLFLGEIV